MVAFADASRFLVHPLSSITGHSLNLNPADLPGYALRTALRMLIALGVSLVFTFTYATWAAKNPRAGSLLVPLLDILQSVPILGFLSVTVVWFLSLSPGRIFGAELACVFTIFTGQAWNMAFSFYQSLRTVPPELEEAGRMFGLNAWARFWRIEAPFAMPPLIWNMMMSMSGGWFFVTISEAISVGKTNIALPGIGSWIAVAIAQKNLPAIFYAIGAMLVVILIYDQLLFRPLVAWADRFRVDSEQSEEHAAILGADRLSPLPLAGPDDRALRTDDALVLSLASAQLRHHEPRCARSTAGSPTSSGTCCWACWALSPPGASMNSSLRPISTGDDLATAVGLGFITMLRVMVLIAIASLIWTPIGIYVGLRPRLTADRAAGGAVPGRLPQQSAVPAGGVADRVLECQSRHLAVAADRAGHPMVHPVQRHRRRQHHAARSCATPPRISASMAGCGGRRVALPAVFPFYVTGAITASGGAWNASVVAEVASWGKHHAARPWPGRLYLRRHVMRAISTMSCWASR